jgi:hypothetical protein
MGQTFCSRKKRGNDITPEKLEKIISSDAGKTPKEETKPEEAKMLPPINAEATIKTIEDLLRNFHGIKSDNQCNQQK